MGSSGAGSRTIRSPSPQSAIVEVGLAEVGLSCSRSRNNSVADACPEQARPPGGRTVGELRPLDGSQNDRSGMSKPQQVRVLIVDDHELVAESFARVLRDEPDMSVVGTAATVAEGLTAARSLDPDVVLLDYQLPDGDGVSAAKKLRMESAAKVIILTGSGNAAARLAASGAGCAGYIEKTMASNGLADVVRRVHSGEVMIPQDDFAALPSLDQLALHYQPIVDLHTEAVTGFEALVRWLHPRRGLLPPGEFIGLAEETGFIKEIGGWVLAEATSQLARWQRDYPRQPPLEMSVNLSVRQLDQPDLTPIVAELVDAANIGGTLVLEITESVMLDASEGVVNTLQTLRSLGASIALDDFGTGYSSLAYLRRLPIDVIKIDKCFTDDLPHGSRSVLLAETICSLGRELNLMTIAEGIETVEQADCLRSMGQLWGQGFYFFRPKPAGDIEAILAAGHPLEASVP